MLFLIDIGNTHSVLGLLKEGKITKQWRIKTDCCMTADELEIIIHNLFSINGLSQKAIEGVIMASVVPQLDSAYSSCFRSLFSSLPPERILNVTSDNVSTLIHIKLKNPEEVGADRLVNGIAAFRKFHKSSIVIDFGTAITFDCISERCEYLGGLILPGLNIALEALAAKAAKLPQIDIMSPPLKVIGTSTVGAMKSGVMNGYGSMIEGLITKVHEEMVASGASDIAVIATGGMASIIKPYAQSIQCVEKDLTLEGLAYIFLTLTGNR